MTEQQDKTEWLYVIVCNPGAEEFFLGLHDQKQSTDFIPVFKSREDADRCFFSISSHQVKKHEVQAVHIEELVATCTNNGFLIALVDHEGNILKQFG